MVGSTGFRANDCQEGGRQTAVRRHALWLVAIAAMLSVALASAGSARAQGSLLVAGTSAETLESIPAVDEGGSQLVLMRLTLEPGATLRRHSHPGTAVMTVISGVLKTELVRGDATIHRVSVNGNGSVSEIAEAGTPVILQPGDAITFSRDAGKTMANGGEEPLVLVASLMIAAGESPFDFDSWPREFNPHLS